MEAADFLNKWVWPAYWAFCSPQKRLSYNNDPSFFLMEVVLMQGVGQLNLGNTSNLDGPPFSPLLGSTSRASWPPEKVR